jgi:hypothetical protein
MYEFEHLLVRDDRFEVDLFFRGIRPRVAVPFDAVTTFIDLSSGVRLVFDSADAQPCGMAI